jgi:hypothetical protein
MTRGELYREFARKCLEVADTVESPDTRLTLFEMARVWHQLAQDQEPRNGTGKPGGAWRPNCRYPDEGQIR